jgi:hypothetical protein
MELHDHELSRNALFTHQCKVDHSKTKSEKEFFQVEKMYVNLILLHGSEPQMPNGGKFSLSCVVSVIE